MHIEESSSAKLTVEELRDVYRRLAPFYGFWEKLGEAKARDAAFEAAAIVDGITVLEIGTGPGAALAVLSERNRSGTTIGVDVSGSMLRRAGKLIRTPRTVLCQCDARHLPFPSASVDLIYGAHVLDLMSPADMQDAVAEMRRVLRPLGRLVLINMRCGHRWFDALWSVLYVIFPNLLGGCRPISVAGYLPDAGFSVVSVREVQQWGIPSEVVLALKQ